jgi:hypothetical protein
MARGMNWEKVRRENMVRAHGWAEKRAEDAALRAARGITNPQAKLLADLKRQLENGPAEPKPDGADQ